MARSVTWIRLVALGVAAAVVIAGCGTTPARDDSSASEGARPSEGRVEVAFAVFPSIARLVPTVDTTGAATQITLDAARGEREGAQVVAWADRGSPRLVFVTGALRGPGGATIAATSVRAYIEQPMRVERGSPAGRSGTFVDPLVPADGRDVVLAPDERLLAWIDVAVSPTARPGVYRGAVELRAATRDGRHATGDDGRFASIPVQVRVHAATLPVRPTLDSSIGVDASQLVRFEGVTSGSRELRTAIDRYAAELAHARLSIADVGTVPPGTLPGHAGLPGDAAFLKRVYDRRGVASVRVPMYLTYPFEDPIGNDRPAALAYLRSVAAWMRRNGYIDRSYVYIVDEPDDADAGLVRELHELVHQADPALRLLVTREASATAFRGSVDIWAPNISPTRFHQADVVRERRAGRDTWWYPSITTWSPYPALFIDELRPTPRALGWLAWRNGVRGFLYWSATHWHEVDDPYRDSATYRETDAVGNGDGVLLYPGGPIGREGRPSPSVRLFQLRDGIEDHDLLTLSSCAGTPAQRRRIAGLARTVAPSLTQIGPTNAQVEALRSATFTVLDRISAQRVEQLRGRAQCSR